MPRLDTSPVDAVDAVRERIAKTHVSTNGTPAATETPFETYVKAIRTRLEVAVATKLTQPALNDEARERINRYLPEFDGWIKEFDSLDKTSGAFKTEASRIGRQINGILLVAGMSTSESASTTRENTSIGAHIVNLYMQQMTPANHVSDPQPRAKG